MFTGIIEEVGAVTAIQRGARSARLTIRAPEITDRTTGGVSVGDSVAIDGICLTVVQREGPDLSFEAVPETVQRTSLKGIERDDRVNLERALAVGGRLGGHFVQGHVDGVGQLTEVRVEDNARVLTIAPPRELMRYIVTKGSIALSGISLTVVDVTPETFTVWIIPHTYANTTLSDRKIGDELNLEVDMLARYLEKLMADQSIGQLVN